MECSSLDEHQSAERRDLQGVAGFGLSRTEQECDVSNRRYAYLWGEPKGVAEVWTSRIDFKWACLPDPHSKGALDISGDEVESPHVYTDGIWSEHCSTDHDSHHWSCACSRQQCMACHKLLHRWHFHGRRTTRSWASDAALGAVGWHSWGQSPRTACWLAAHVAPWRRAPSQAQQWDDAPRVAQLGRWACQALSSCRMAQDAWDSVISQGIQAKANDIVERLRD